MKFAMVPINRKEEDDGIHIRRVLISYKYKTSKRFNKTKYKTVTYHGTKLIASDPYFNEPNHTHIYELTDKYYKLVTVDAANPMSEAYEEHSKIYNKRKYHTNIWPGGIKCIEFKTNNKDEAISLFNNREELR